ncbi:potassium-transporting ATPase subunit B, partial [Frankia sp. Mgl5]|nr:potassium-transporting ATPase subunit B [Frankia sp. Mgl5]
MSTTTIAAHQDSASAAGRRETPPAQPRRVGGGLLDPKQLWTSLPSAVRKLDPRTLWHNPVMLIVEVGAAYTTVLAITDPSAFGWMITVWLWLTVIFANL